MIWALQNSYESPLSIDTKKVPVALRFTSQWRFNNVIVTKNNIFTDLRWKYADVQIFAKNPSKNAILMGFFANYERKWLL